MEKLNLEQMENIRGGHEPVGTTTDPWGAENGECFLRLNTLLTFGYDPGDIIDGYWKRCDS